MSLLPPAEVRLAQLATLDLQFALPTLEHWRTVMTDEEMQRLMLEGISTLCGNFSGTNIIGAVSQNGAWTVAVSGNVNVVGPLTDAELRASAVPVLENALPTVLHGEKLVTTAGTRVTLAAATPCRSVTIKALTTNTGTIYVGSATVAAANGFPLAAGDTVSLDVADLSTINLDATVNGEGVRYIGLAA